MFIGSDGWDRTSQTVALAEMLLDPYYRTLVGFEQLVEKEFLSFGHKVAQRSGHYQDISDFADKERSPVFLQFIDAVSQLLLQFPTAFEFNSKLLVAILDHLYSCLFGTFLLNCDRERKEAMLHSKTLSFWDYVDSNQNCFVNANYNLNNEVLYPDISLASMQLWYDYYTRYTAKEREKLPTGIEMMPHDFVVNVKT
jgi:myotubularin-related protein 1/2